MKKILNILLLTFLLNVTSISQVVVNASFAAQQITTVDASAFGVTSTTFVAHRLYLFIAMTTGTTNNGTITSTTTTWANVINTGNSTRRIQIFRFLPTVTVTNETVQIGSFGGGSTGSVFDIWEISGIDFSGSNGANAIVQSVATSGSGADPSITMSTFGNSLNTGLAFFFNDNNPFSGTPESGWTEDIDGGYNTPTAGGYTMYRNRTGDNTPTVTAASSTWIGVGIEIRNGGRRPVIIN